MIVEPFNDHFKFATDLTTITKSMVVKLAPGEWMSATSKCQTLYLKKKEKKKKKIATYIPYNAVPSQRIRIEGLMMMK